MYENGWMKLGEDVQKIITTKRSVWHVVVVSNQNLCHNTCWPRVEFDAEWVLYIFFFAKLFAIRWASVADCVAEMKLS